MNKNTYISPESNVISMTMGSNVAQFIVTSQNLDEGEARENLSLEEETFPVETEWESGNQ